MMEHVVLLLFRIVLTFVAKGIRKLRREMRKLFKNRWLEVPAKIEIVSVVDYPEVAEFIKTYIGLLTYFYRNPDLHTGDYAVEFESEWQARAWVNQFKGRHVTVRVNPRDPEDSILLQLPIHSHISRRAPAPAAPEVPPPAPKPIRIQALSPAQKTWAENCRLTSAAGLGASLVVLALNIAFGGHAKSPVLYSLGGSLIAFVFVSLGILSLRLIAQDSVRALPRFYALWCTRKMTRFLIISGSVLIILFLYSIDRMQFPAEARAEIGVHVPYIAASWIFLISWALHNAILRSQQSVAAHQESISG